MVDPRTQPSGNPPDLRPDRPHLYGQLQEQDLLPMCLIVFSEVQANRTAIDEGTSSPASQPLLKLRNPWMGAMAKDTPRNPTHPP